MVSRYVSNFTLGIGPGNPSGHPPPHVTPMPLGVAMAATAAAAAAAASVPQQPGQSQGQSQQQAQASQSLKGPNPTDYHVQQCLVQGPSGPPQAQHQHYRILHSRSDGYVASSAGFSAPQSGPPHQGPPAVLRGMQSTPPTPPQQDLNKMQQPTQSMFVPQGSTNSSGNVRPSQQTNIFRGATSSSTPRGPRHNIATMPPTMYQPQIQQVQQVVMPYTPFAPRQQTSQIYSSTHFSHFPQQQLPNFATYPPFYFPTNSLLSTQHRPSVPSGIVQPPSGPTLGPTGSQGQMTMSAVLTQAGPTGAVTSSGAGNTAGKRKAARPHAIPIIHPESHKNVLEEMELSKAQSANAELDYQEHVNMTSGDHTSSGTQQSQDIGMTADSNCNNKAMQGMAYVDIMQHHKMGAMSPCQTSYNQVNEMIGPTPIVSAMSDAPSVEIHPKQQTKKKNKSIEIVAPPPPTPPASEKVVDNKNQTSVHTESKKDEISEPVNISEITTTCSFSAAQSTEEDIENKAIQIQSNIESTHNSAELINTDTSNAETITEKSSEKNSEPILSNQQSKQSPQTCSQQSQTTPISSEHSSASSSPILQSSSSSSPPPSLKRDTKGTLSSSASHLLPPLPPNSSSSSNQTTAATATIATPPTSPSSNKPEKSGQQSLSSSPSSASNKQAAASISTNSNVLAAITGKQSKGKDKHNQQQQATGPTAVVAGSVATNNNSSSSTASTQVDNNIKTQTKQNSVNNNVHHQQPQPEKMKLETEDKQQQKLGVGNNASNNIDKMDASNNLNISSSSNKKISDKNENIIPCKNYAAEDGNSLPLESLNTTEVASDDNNSSTVIVSGVSVQQSLDETDKATITTEMASDDNVNYYKRTNNNNNNEKFANVDTKSSSQASKPEFEDANVQTNSIVADNSVSKELDSQDQDPAQPSSTRGSSDDINSNERAIDSAGIANGHAIMPSTKPETKGAPATSTAQETLIKYNDGQWSPSNQEGVKVYDRQQLLTLRDAPASKIEPKVNSKVASNLLLSTRSPQPSLMPPFMLNSSNKRGGQSMGSRNLSIGGSMSGSANASSYNKQSSMSGVNAKNSSKGSKTGMIHVSLSLREDVKLNETENAWRPTHLKYDDTKTPEMIETEELYRRVRGILNKLTPEKFETLVEQIMRLQIDTAEKITGVMELVFEKAVDEPNFSVSYARLCQRLGDIKIVTEEANTQKHNFKSALIDKTENEFSHNVLNRQAKEKLQPITDKIKECTDPDRKLELTATYEDEERKIRRRSGGTVRFIGELFKISMLTGHIINSCIESLLDPNSEDKLECLCKLLETVGKKFEITVNSKDPKQRLYNLDTVIKKMQAIADRKIDGRISSRVRFMLQDVIDLRKSKWASSRIDLNPKTMEQIQKEAKTEQISNQYMNYNMMPNKKDDRRYGGGGGGGVGGGGGGGSGGGSGNNNMSFGGGGGGGGGYFGKGTRQQQNDDTWYTQTGKGSRAVDTSKLGSMLSNTTNIDAETTLGTKSQFIWNTYGSMRQQSATPTATTTNSFAALSSLDSNKGSNSGPRNKGSYNKGSMERDRYDVVHSRTGSAHGSRESSSSRNPTSRGSSNVQKSTSYQNYNSSAAITPRSSVKTGTSGTSSQPSSTSASLASVQIPAAPPTAVFDDLESDQNQAIMSALNEIVEFAIDGKMEECIPVIKKFPDGARWGFLYNILYDYLHLGKTKPVHRRSLAKVILFMFSNNFMSIEHFKKGYQEFCELAADTVIDVPDAWNYVFQFMVPLIHKKVVTIKDIWNDTLKETRQGEKFLKNLILQCTREIGPNFMINLWESSGLKWTNFIDKANVDRFIKDNQFQFIESKDAEPPLPSNPDVHKIMDRVKELLNDGATTDAIIDYISGNIVDIDKAFIRGLTTTLCNYAIQNRNNYVLDQKRFQNICIHLLQRYVDLKEDRELECLYAIQLLVNSLEHPSGLLSEIFGELYDAYVITRKILVVWRDSKEEPAGKGVAVKALNPFFNNILSGETSDENN